MAGELPAFVRAMRAVKEMDGLTVYEKSALSAAVQWVSFDSGKLWPSKAEWAAAAGMSERQLFNVLRSLVRKGVAALTGKNSGGRGKPAEWTIPALAVDAKLGTVYAGITEAETRQETRHGDELNPAPQVHKPGTPGRNPAPQVVNPAQAVPTNSPEQPKNYQELSSSVANPPERGPGSGAVERFLADRAIRTGVTPPGFAEFIARYPAGRATNRVGALEQWRASVEPSDVPNVLAGLETWLASEQFREGYAPKAEKFLRERHWEQQPPPPKSKGVITADDAVSRFRARQAAKAAKEGA